MYKFLVACSVLMFSTAAVGQELTADEIIRKAMDHYRGQTSHAQMSMVIHRPDWQREMGMKTWTEGDKRTLVLSLIHISEPTRQLASSRMPSSA